MKMRRKGEKERGQRTVYSAFWPANARVGFNFGYLGLALLQKRFF
jgi:hypothetical protein